MLPLTEERVAAEIKILARVVAVGCEVVWFKDREDPLRLSSSNGGKARPHTDTYSLSTPRFSFALVNY